MKVIAGDLPTGDGYSVSGGSIARFTSRSTRVIDRRTVESVEPMQNFRQTNYGKTGEAMGIGAIVAGPVGAVIGGLGGAIFKGNVTVFRISFRNGEQVICQGSQDEFHRVLKYSMRGEIPGARLAALPQASGAPEVHLAPAEASISYFDAFPNSPEQAAQLQETAHPRPVNHWLHGTVTFFTAGLWAPVWIVKTLLSKRR